MYARSLVLFTALTLASSARADDWPQWLGPERDCVWRETDIVEKFPGRRSKDPMARTDRGRLLRTRRGRGARISMERSWRR